jgi:aminoglycoside phosphotransferase family enzyme/predicted kinase
VASAGTSGDSGQQQVIDFLSSPATYGLAGDRAVERIETHGAYVFLAGDHAYKLKRAIKFPYMDFSTPDRRRAVCERELQVNRRTAPGIYLEVRAIVKDGALLRFANSGVAPKDAIDWVVVLRRFDQDNLFERLCQRGKLTQAMMRDLADVIADFHRTAEPTPRYGGAAGIKRVLEGDLGEFQSLDQVFDTAKVERLTQLSVASLERLAPLLERRREGGLVRHGHGDLHLNNICLFEGKPTLFDALEFDEALASIDVFYDLAFLLMDLDRQHRRGLANAVLNRYLEQRLDFEGLQTLPLFLGTRAAIRAHVTARQAGALDPLTKQKLMEARALLDRAIAYLEPPGPRMIVIGGLSGSGKTTTARVLAALVGPAPGAVIIRSDVVRKQLMGVHETDRLPQSAYTPEMSEKVFSSVAERAATVLSTGHAVITDAVYGETEQRDQIRSVARRAGVPLDAVWLEAPAPVLKMRIASREGDASDATVEVMMDQRARIARPAGWLAVDAARPVDAIVADIKRRLAL